MPEHSGRCPVKKWRIILKVNIERDIDIKRLLINLDEKSLCKDPGMAGYEVTVSKQLLRDAHDVIKQLYKGDVVSPKYKIGQKFFIDDNWHVSYKWLGRACGVFVIYKIEDYTFENGSIKYFLELENNKNVQICVDEYILDRNKML